MREDLKKDKSKETRRPESPDFYLAGTAYPAQIRRFFLSQYPNYSRDNHWHDEVEFTLVLRGRMTCNVDGEICHLATGDGIFINARQMHRFYSEDMSECEFVALRFHPRILCATQDIEQHYVLPVIENANYTYQYLSPKIEWQRNVLDSVSRVYYMRHENTMDLVSIGWFFLIWEKIYIHSVEETAKTRTSSPQLTQLKKMISFIEENYRNKITLEDICRAGNLGKTNCCKVFGKYLHQTPVIYLTTFRLRKGAQLLVETDMPINDIAYEVGFSGPSYFAEAFRKHIGEMPSEYRKSHFGR